MIISYIELNIKLFEIFYNIISSFRSPSPNSFPIIVILPSINVLLAQGIVTLSGVDAVFEVVVGLSIADAATGLNM